MQVSDISVSTILQIGAVVVGLALAWGASKAQDAAQDARITALEKTLADSDKRSRDERAGWMMRAWQRREAQPVCAVAAPRG